MPGTMSRADLVTDLKGLLKDASDKFTGTNGSDFWRHLTIAAQDLGRFRPRTLVGSLTLVADKSNYDSPADLVAPKYSRWGKTEQRNRKPWASNAVGCLPRLSLAGDVGARELWLMPAPTAEQIADFGSAYSFFYYATHKVDPDPTKTTVSPDDRSLLLIRAAAQALLELAADGVSKPVSLGNSGVGSMPKNGTPSALSDKLMELFEGMAA